MNFRNKNKIWNIFSKSELNDMLVCLRKALMIIYLKIEKTTYLYGSNSQTICDGDVTSISSICNLNINTWINVKKRPS